MRPMPKLWPWIYAMLIPVCCHAGYRIVRDAGGMPSGVHWVEVAVAFVAVTIAPLLLVAYGFLHSRKERMRRPSWDRHPFGWWTDTLQPLRVSVVSGLAYAAGAASALPAADEKGRMTFFLLAAIATGMAIGERLVYVVYRGRIG
ncbi:hypothetical protein OVA24_16865 [Luteolibacter sp. SL250]|uniref:hypothetical protein n=1 Tax=Luteolibacter sp. SL250 TaxID=2995170 RepID=UPI00226E42CC|nr:hypothetical protein [Luteolibacter sp. SL250]WAC18905.1 hypothetical protein OVA24_16865 [Luteolibacter sp. SL250]